MKKHTSHFFIVLIVFCTQNFKIEAVCAADIDTSSSTDLSAYDDGYDLGVASPGKELYMLSDDANVCAKYVKECTKFNACKDGYKARSTGEPYSKPTSS